MKKRSVAYIAAGMILATQTLCLAQGGADAKPEGKGPTPAELAKLAEGLASSSVVVEYTVKYDKADSPGNDYSGRYSYRADWSMRGGWETANWDQMIKEERPAERAGYVLSPTKVLTSDPQLHPRFIQSIAVRFNGKTIDAKISGYAKDRDAVVLELASPLDGAKPLTFDATKAPPYLGASYFQEEDQWGMAVGSSGGSQIVALPDGRKFTHGSSNGLIMDRQGNVVAAVFGNDLPVDDSWKGSPEKWAMMSQAEMDAALKKTEELASQCVVRVQASLRSPRQGAAAADPYGGYFGGSDQGSDSMTEWNGSGILLDDKTVLILANFKPKTTARLEGVRVFVGDSEEATTGSFTGTLKDYGGFIATLDKPLPGAAKPFTGAVTDVRNKLLLKAEVAVLGETRTAYYSRDRIGGFHLGWKRELFPQADAARYDSGMGYGGEGSAGNFLFTDDGKLYAIPIARREKVAVEERGYYGYGGGGSETIMLPVSYLVRDLANRGTSIETENRPLTEAEENRLAWLGVEMQAMDPDLARVNKVVDQTAGGNIGGIVTYIYPDSPAAKAGIQDGDILLRFHVKGQPKPLDVEAGSYDDMGGMMDRMWDMIDQMPDEYLDRMPTPWGSVETTLTRSLTDIGFGTPFTADVWRDGKLITKDFTIELGPAHYNSAARFKSEASGISARDLTYEVRRYYQLKTEEPGVLVSKVEKGSRGAVAGVKMFEIIQTINDKPVTNVKEFEEALAPGGEFKLFVKRMTEGRTVKIKIASASEAEKTKQEKGEGEGEEEGGLLKKLIPGR